MAETALVPVRLHGWRTGLGNLLAKEHGIWWRTTRWAIHLVLWLAVINGFLLLVTFGDGDNFRDPRRIRELLEVFFRAGGLFATIGAITVTQSLLVGEKQLGTMAWLLTKPVSRPAVILAKWLATSYAVLFLMWMVPAALLNANTRLVWGEWPVMPGFLAGLGLLALSHVFYVTFVLMLGTFFRRRGPVSGSAFGFMIAGMILPNFAPKALVMATPWTLHALAAAHGTGGKLPPGWTTPVVATGVWIAACLAVALWRFGKEEF